MRRIALPLSFVENVYSQQTYSCCSSHGQSGLLLHQLVPLQNWLGEIPPRKHRSLSLHPPGVCVRCHWPHISHHWGGADGEKSLRNLHGAEEKVKRGAPGCPLLSCWTVPHHMCFFNVLSVVEQEPQAEDFTVGQSGQPRTSVSISIPLSWWKSSICWQTARMAAFLSTAFFSFLWKQDLLHLAIFYCVLRILRCVYVPGRCIRTHFDMKIDSKKIIINAMTQQQWNLDSFPSCAGTLPWCPL